MTQDQDPKIIVDDGWKEQVQKEKDQLERESEQSENDANIPEASFGLLVTTLTTQALSAMGFVPNPMTGQAETNPALAKHFIDSLGVLQEKTVGNLTSEESSLLTESLHQLRMAFVSLGSAVKDSEESAPSIELP